MSTGELGKRFGKPDIERLGLFSEMSYMNGKGYVPIQGKRTYLKGTNFVTSGRKSKNGTQHGYFEDEFKRLFIGEGITRRKPRQKTAVPQAPFVVNMTTKLHSTPGDKYGTFTKTMDAFSPVSVKPKYVHEPLNFVWGSAKMGGPGYADICINEYPPHLPDRYGLPLQMKQYGKILDGPFISAIQPKPYFENDPYTEKKTPSVGLYLDRSIRKKAIDGPAWMPNSPAKWQAGCHAGCFDPFPTYMHSKYVSIIDANKPRGIGKLDGPPFVPIPQTIKSLNTVPIIDASVDMFMHTDNMRTYEPCYIKNLQVDLSKV